MEPEPKFDAAKMYQRVGEFVVAFQWFEVTVLNILWLLDQPRMSWDERLRTSEIRFVEKLDKAANRFSERMDDLERWSRNGTLPQTVEENARHWRARFASIISDCRVLNRQRNEIVHSSYVHLEAGGEIHGIVRSKVVLERRGTSDDFELRSKDALPELDDALKEMATLSLALGTAQLQIVHWSAHWNRDSTD